MKVKEIKLLSNRNGISLVIGRKGEYAFVFDSDGEIKFRRVWKRGVTA